MIQVMRNKFAHNHRRVPAMGKVNNSGKSNFSERSIRSGKLMARRCDECVNFERCVEESGVDEDETCAHYVDSDFIVGYPARPTGESRWLEMSYYRYNQSSLDCRLSEYDLMEW